MIHFTRSPMDGYVRIDGDGCAGLLTIEELRQLASHDTREEILALIVEIESPIAKCERASERMRALLNDTCPPTERNDR